MDSDTTHSSYADLPSLAVLIGVLCVCVCVVLFNSIPCLGPCIRLLNQDKEHFHHKDLSCCLLYPHPPPTPNLISNSWQPPIHSPFLKFPNF